MSSGFVGELVFIIVIGVMGFFMFGVGEVSESVLDVSIRFYVEECVGVGVGGSLFVIFRVYMFYRREDIDILLIFR